MVSRQSEHSRTTGVMRRVKFSSSSTGRQVVSRKTWMKNHFPKTLPSLSVIWLSRHGNPDLEQSVVWAMASLKPIFQPLFCNPSSQLWRNQFSIHVHPKNEGASIWIESSLFFFFFADLKVNVREWSILVPHTLQRWLGWLMNTYVNLDLDRPSFYRVKSWAIITFCLNSCPSLTANEIYDDDQSRFDSNRLPHSQEIGSRFVKLDIPQTLKRNEELSRGSGAGFQW